MFVIAWPLIAIGMLVAFAAQLVLFWGWGPMHFADMVAARIADRRRMGGGG